MDLIKKFGETHKKPTYRQAMKFVRKYADGQKGENHIILKNLVQTYSLTCRVVHDSFTYKKEGRKSYRVREVKRGITRYFIVDGVGALRQAQKAHKEKVKQETITPVLYNNPVVQRKAKPQAVRISDKVSEFYSTLKDHYYVIKNFALKMYDEEDDQVYMLSSSGQDIAELIFTKFYLSYNEPEIPDRDDIAFWHYKKVDDYFVLIIVPKLFFRNSRVFFETYFPYGKEITVEEAKRMWTTVERTYGYEETLVLINDIEKTKKGRKFIYTKYLEKRREAKKVNKEQLEKIMALDCEVLKSPAKPLPLVFRSNGRAVGLRNHSDRNVNRYAENRLMSRIDRKLKAERAEVTIQKIVKGLYK